MSFTGDESMRYALWAANLVQLVVFGCVLYAYATAQHYRCVCQKYSYSFPVAKAAATLINANTALTLLSSLRVVRRLVHISTKEKAVHLYCICWLWVWSLVHMTAHYINFSKLGIVQVLTWGVGYTGQVLFLILVVMTASSIPWMRKRMYQSFLGVHYALALAYMVLINIHGTFCFFRDDWKRCAVATTWMWTCVPLLMVVGLMFWKYVACRRTVAYARSHAGDVVEFGLVLPSCYAGKTVWVCCPSLSLFDWHPFTITGEKDGVCSVHMKARGDWTEQFSRRLGVETNPRSVFPAVMPQVLVDGPYKCMADYANEVLSSVPTVLVSTGIGVTAYVHLLRQMEGQEIRDLQCHFVFRSPEEAECFLPLFEEVSRYPSTKVVLYFTAKGVRELVNMPLPYKLRRPIFEDILDEMYMMYGSQKVAVYYSGRKAAGHDLQHVCEQRSNRYYCTLEIIH